MAKKDYYDTIGIARNASADEIKKAYRKLAMQYHPDRNPGDKVAEEKFKEIQEAYSILSDDKKRTAYDQFGHAGVDPSSMGGGAGGFGFGGGGGFDFGDVGDIFEHIFGGGRGGARGSSQSSSTRPQRGADLAYSLNLSLEDAVHGITEQIRIPVTVNCEACVGSGARKGTKPETCSTCNGIGQVRMQQGFFTVQQTCPDCRGRGKMIKDPCPECHGQGKTRKTKTLAVKIPAGVDEGDQIRLAGEGEAGSNGGPTGDLYVQINVLEHAIFHREANDLHCAIPIDFITAALGGEVEVPTLEGGVKLKIPPETQGGKLFRLRGKGVKAARSGRVGDLICKVMVETPVRLNGDQKNLLKQFGDSLSKDASDHSPQAHHWFDNVKKFFAGRAH